MGRSAALLLFVALVAVGGWFLFSNGAKESGGVLGGMTGKMASLEAIGTFRPSEWNGKPYVIHFFSVTLPGAQPAHEVIGELARAGIPVVGIAIKDTVDDVRTFLDQNGSPFEDLAYDEEGTGASAWGVTGPPETFVVDGSGKIRFHYKGPITSRNAHDKLLPLWWGLHT